jgi:hypothetical protein
MRDKSQAYSSFLWCFSATKRYKLPSEPKQDLHYNVACCADSETIGTFDLSELCLYTNEQAQWNEQNEVPHKS